MLIIKLILLYTNTLYLCILKYGGVLSYLAVNSNTYWELVCVLRKIEKSQRMKFVNVEGCNGSSLKAI